MIRVLHHYRGVPSDMKRIYPGEYAPDDPRLFGLADYLVSNGHAERLPNVEPEAPEEKPSTPRRKRGQS